MSESCEGLSVPSFTCKLPPLRVVQRVAYLEKTAIVEHDILLVFTGDVFKMSRKSSRSNFVQRVVVRVNT